MTVYTYNEFLFEGIKIKELVTTINPLYINRLMIYIDKILKYIKVF